MDYKSANAGYISLLFTDCKVLSARVLAVNFFLDDRVLEDDAPLLQTKSLIYASLYT